MAVPDARLLRRLRPDPGADWRDPVGGQAEPRTVDWLGGAAFMVRRSVLEQLGGFDENFFMYMEETDLCKRTGMPATRSGTRHAPE